jgi:Arc/MetJ-type ribon-helix-helix transcriptional regulator
MVIGMATVKVTITLQDEKLQEIRALVASGQAASISGFVQHAVAVALHDAAGWRELLGEALDSTGGPLTNKERAWADSVLSGKALKRGSRKRPAA